MLNFFAQNILLASILVAYAFTLFFCLNMSMDLRFHSHLEGLIFNLIVETESGCPLAYLDISLTPMMALFGSGLIFVFLFLSFFLLSIYQISQPDDDDVKNADCDDESDDDEDSDDDDDEDSDDDYDEEDKYPDYVDDNKEKVKDEEEEDENIMNIGHWENYLYLQSATNDFYRDLNRLPIESELPDYSIVSQKVKNAFRVIMTKSTMMDIWAADKIIRGYWNEKLEEIKNRPGYYIKNDYYELLESIEFI